MNPLFEGRRTEVLSLDPLQADVLIDELSSHILFLLLYISNKGRQGFPFDISFCFDGNTCMLYEYSYPLPYV